MAQQPFGSFIPTTSVWDVTSIYQTEGITPELKELLVRLYQNLNNMAVSTNLKDAGYYNTQEFVNGQQFFPNPANSSQTAVQPDFRSVFRMIVNFGALPNAGTKSVAHGIAMTSSFSFTRIYATATNPTTPKFIPIPYASNSANSSVEINVDGTNVNITTAANLTAYTITYVILEYLKS